MRCDFFAAVMPRSIYPSDDRTRAGARSSEWDQFGDDTDHWLVTTGKSRTEELDEFKRSVLEKAQALCLDKVPQLAELLGDLGHVDRSR